MQRPRRCGAQLYDHVRLHQPHPMFTAGDIRWRNLYEVDVAELTSASRDVFSPTAITSTLHNTAVMAARLPRWVHAENGLDLTALFPWRRRMFSLAKFFVFINFHRNQLSDALDVVRERFDIRRGLLQHAAPKPQAPAYSLQAT